MLNFDQLQVKSWIKQYCKGLGIKNLTPIQEAAIPPLLHNDSLIITSQTGSGKTFCFLLPILNKINVESQATEALIVAPTKELARQIYSTLLPLYKYIKLPIALAIGNNDWNSTKNKFKKNPQKIIIGTPSKINELLVEKIISRSDINTVVFDEADMLLDSGFLNITKSIFGLVDKPNLQKIACSATTHESLANSLSNYFKNTKVVSLGKNIWSNQQITHNLVYNFSLQPMDILCDLIATINPYFCIIFANTRNEAQEIYTKLTSLNIPNIGLLHKDIDLNSRKQIFANIQKNKYQYLVATDLVSRGIDIPGADVVISYGLPEEDIWYMHRIGRVGRYKDTGVVYTIYRSGIDNVIRRLENKNIKFNYLQDLDKKLVAKKFELRIKKKQYLDEKTNNEIKKIFYAKKKVQPCYKKKKQIMINKITQKKRHEFIDKIIKKKLIEKWKNDTKSKK